MKFYQENKINPLASCLPLLLQLPVFISLFYMLRTDLKKHICGDAAASSTTRHDSARRSRHARVDTVGHLPSKYIEKTSCETRRAALGEIPVPARHHRTRRRALRSSC